MSDYYNNGGTITVQDPFRRLTMDQIVDTSTYIDLNNTPSNWYTYPSNSSVTTIPFITGTATVSGWQPSYIPFEESFASHEEMENRYQKYRKKRIEGLLKIEI